MYSNFLSKQFKIQNSEYVKANKKNILIEL